MPTVSHSWKASVPIRWVGTWPVITTSGMESIRASTMPVTALVAPGPEVTSTTPGLAGRARIALGGVGRALLVAHQDVAQARLVEEGVIDRQHRAARIAEEVGHPLVDQGPHDHLGAGEGLGRGLRVGVGGTYRRVDGHLIGSAAGWVWGKEKGPRGALGGRDRALTAKAKPPPASIAD